MIRYISLICLLTIVFIPPIVAETMTYQYKFSPPEIIDQNGVTSIRISEASDILRNQGNPEMPYKRVILDLPAGTEVNSVIAHPLETTRLELINPVKNFNGLHRLNSERSILPGLPQPLHSPDKIMDWNYLGGIDSQTFNRKSILILRIFPVQIMETGNIIFSSAINVDINISASKKNLPSTYKPNRDTYSMLIIAPDDFMTAAENFALYKTDSGLFTHVVSLSEIQAGYDGIDDAQKMKRCIRDYVSTNSITYVLLAGDSDTLPVRHCPQENDPYGDMNLPVELYFADLFDGAGNPNSWDADDDNRFGEYPADLPALDLLPDVFLSRIPASSIEELTVAFNHIIAYETFTSATDPWFNRVILNGVDTFTESEHGDTTGIPEGERYAEFLADTLFSSNEIIRLYETDLYPHDAPVLPENIVQYTSSGTGFMAFHCHGAPDCLWVEGQCFSHTHTEALTNGEMLPLIYGFACSTAEFDIEIPPLPGTIPVESMPEHFLLNPAGGAIAYVGATRYAFASAFPQSQHRTGSGGLEYPYFMAFKDGCRTPATMLAAAEKYYLENAGANNYYDFYNVAEHALFGDPSLSVGGLPSYPILSSCPHKIEQITGDDDQCIESGETFQLSIPLINHGIAADEVTATLTASLSEIQILNDTATYGTVQRGCRTMPMTPFTIQINADPNHRGIITLHADIYIHGNIHRTEELNIFAGSGPHLVYLDWEVRSDSTENMVVDPGDWIDPSILIRNAGCETAYGVSIDLETDSPYVDECGPGLYSDCGDIPSNSGYITQWRGIRFHVIPECPNETIIPFQAIFTSSDGGTWIMPFDVLVQDHLGPMITDIEVNPRSAETDQAVRIRLTAQDSSGVETVRAIAIANNSDHTTEIQLADDGLHGDGSAGDGIYGGQFGTPLPENDFYIDITAEDRNGNISLFNHVSAFTTRPIHPADVLIISDSGRIETASVIASSLDAIQKESMEWDTIYRGNITESILMNYLDAITIWSYGPSKYPSAPERALMSSYLDEGGAIMLCGWDLARYIDRTSDREWLETRFGVDFQGKNAGTYLLEGIPDDPIGDSLTVRLKNGYGGIPMTADKLLAIHTGIPFLEYWNDTGFYGGVRARQPGCKTIFLAFSPEDIKYEDQRQILLQNSLNWLADRPSETRMIMTLNSQTFTPGDRFLLTADLVNALDVFINGEVYIALAISNEYWFWPSWSSFPVLDWKNIMIAPYATHSETVLDFTWPDTSSCASEIMFIGAFLDPNSEEIWGELCTIKFSYLTE